MRRSSTSNKVHSSFTIRRVSALRPTGVFGSREWWLAENGGRQRAAKRDPSLISFDRFSIAPPRLLHSRHWPERRLLPDRSQCRNLHLGRLTTSVEIPHSSRHSDAAC